MPSAVTTASSKGGAGAGADLLQVFELALEQDGSPGSEKAVSLPEDLAYFPHGQSRSSIYSLLPELQYVRLPPPSKPYILRFSIEAGSTACRDGSLWTNYPPPGKKFSRKDFWEHK